MKTTKKATWISGVLLESPFHIVICDTEDKFKELLKQTEMKEPDYPEWISKGNDGTTHFLGGDELLCVVCIKKDARKLATIGSIIHEATHVWQFILETMREKNPGDEIEAYAIQHIAQEFIGAVFEDMNS